MNIKQKIYTMVFGEMIMFIIIIGVIVTIFLSIIKLNNDAIELRNLSEKVLVAKSELLCVYNSPISIQFEKLVSSREEIEDTFKYITEDTKLKDINKDVEDAINSIEKIEDLIIERWDNFNSLIKLVIDDSNTFMFSSTVPLVQFYKEKNKTNVNNYEQIIHHIQKLEESIDILEGALRSAYDEITINDKYINDEIRAKIINLVTLNSIIFTIILAAMILITSRISAKMVSNIVSFEKGIIQLKNGILNTDFNINSSDEIGTLGRALNEFSTSLISSIKNIKVSSERNIQMKEELFGSTNNSAISANEIVVAIEEISNGMNNLNSEITKSGLSVSIANKKTIELKEIIIKQNEMIESSTYSIKKIIESINIVNEIITKRKSDTEKLIITSYKGGEQLNETIDIIQGINSNADKIKEIISIIQDVSTRTSILSMNAAIEAAHAGEFGKGFSIVAEEIRGLAEESNHNTKEIETVLKTVISDVELAVKSGDETYKKFSDISSVVREFANALEEIIININGIIIDNQKILELINKLSDFTVNVKTSSNSMYEASNRVADAFKMIEIVTSNVFSSIKGIDGNIENINNALNMVVSISNQLSVEARVLDDEISKFSLN